MNNSKLWYKIVMQIGRIRNYPIGRSIPRAVCHAWVIRNYSSRMMLRDEVKLYEVEGPQLSHVCGYSRIPYTSKKYPQCKHLEHVRFTWESLHARVELYSKPTIPCWERRCSIRKMNEVFQTMVTRSSVPQPAILVGGELS
jgi:hypothetical protein